MSDPPIRARWLTPPGTAALGLLQLEGEDLSGLLGTEPPEPGQIRLRTIADLDACVLARTDARTLLVTPHGGPRIRQRLTAWLLARGACFESQASPWAIATEDPVMRRVLETLPRAASPDALPLLLAQPGRWARHGPPGPADAERSRRLRRLVDPALVALVGPPNAGKSSLLNALAGRAAALASPEAGTTRDHVTVSVSLAGTPPCRRGAGGPGDRQGPRAGGSGGSGAAARRPRAGVHRDHASLHPRANHDRPARGRSGGHAASSVRAHGSRPGRTGPSGA